MPYLRRIHWAVWLGVMFVGLTIITVLIWSHSAARQRAIYAQLTRKGRVELSPRMFFFVDSGNAYIITMLAWIGRRCGSLPGLDDHWWYAIATVGLSGADVVDEDLELLRQCPDLEELILNETSITKVGLKSIASCPRLQVLWIKDAPLIEEEELVCLANMPALRRLSLTRCNFTGLGLRGNFTGRGLRHLQTLPALEELEVSYTELDEVGLKEMQLLKQVRRWYFARVPLTSGTLKDALLKFHQIEVLEADLTPDDEREVQRAFPGANINPYR